MRSNKAFLGLTHTSFSPPVQSFHLISSMIIKLGTIRSIALKAFLTANERLESFLCSKPLLSGIQERDLVPPKALIVTIFCSYLIIELLSLF